MKRLIKFGVSLLSALLLSLPLGAQMVTASFDGTPLHDVIAKLKEQTGCSVISSDKIDLESYTVTASLNKTPLSEALSKIFKAPLSAELKGNVHFSYRNRQGRPDCPQTEDFRFCPG